MKRAVCALSLCLAAAAAVAAANFGALPLGFERNEGQAAPEVLFCTSGASPAIFIASNELIIATSPAATPLRLQFLGANPHARVTASEQLAGRINYLIGSEPQKWITDVPLFAKVCVADVYPGIDLLYYGNQRLLEHDFVVKAGASPRAIALGVRGADQLRVDEAGDLIVQTAGGELRLNKPLLHQPSERGREEVAGKFAVDATARVIRFDVASYDAHRELVIDPVLVFSTFLGGNTDEVANAVALDPAGHVYITGFTESSKFPTNTPIQKLGGLADVFVTKLDASGTNLVYSTVLGGSSNEVGNAIAIDAAGNAYVVGYTDSTNFPTVNAIQSKLGGNLDAFIAKLGPEGTNLVFSTYLGGTNDDDATAVAVDAGGNLFVAGATASTNSIVTTNAFQRSLRGGTDGFVMKVDASGTNVLYSTFLGGTNNDGISGLALDTNGNAFVTGFTHSTDFPLTNAIQNTLNLSVSNTAADAFVTELDAAGASLVYSTFLGGSNDDLGAAIAVDADGNAYITGTTRSDDFPTRHALRNELNLGNLSQQFTDAFLAKLSAAGSNLVYSTYLGGERDDAGLAIAVDGAGDAYVAGQTASDFFPSLPRGDALQVGCRGCGDGFHDAFVLKVGSDGTNFVYSTFLGGGVDEAAFGVAVDAETNTYVVGFTTSGDFPRAQPLQLKNKGAADAFITKLTEKIIYDMAVVAIRAPRRVRLHTGGSVTNRVAVKIQNRSQHDEIVHSADDLTNLVSLVVESLGTNCPSPAVVLHTGRPQRRLPLTLHRTQILPVFFDVVFDCANDLQRTTKRDPNHDDFRYAAAIDLSAFNGHSDSHTNDDVCPRSVTRPFEIDPYPNGRIHDRGCGRLKPDGTLGADVLTDVIVK